MDVKEVSFSYGKTKILDKISFSLKEGKITTIIGANGCGKSTLFKLMTRNLVPTSGFICLIASAILVTVYCFRIIYSLII